MSKEIKELQRIRSILSYVTGFEDDDQENIEDARKSVGRVIDSLADQPAQQEPVAWKNAAIRLGEELSSVGPDGYYDMTAEQWLDWAMDQRPQGKNSLPAQRTWQGLTDKEAMQICVDCGCLSEDWLTFLDAIEAKLRSKNA